MCRSRPQNYTNKKISNKIVTWGWDFVGKHQHRTSESGGADEMRDEVIGTYSFTRFQTVLPSTENSARPWFLIIRAYEPSGAAIFGAPL